jgi:hypothetical protein
MMSSERKPQGLLKYMDEQAEPEELEDLRKEYLVEGDKKKNQLLGLQEWSRVGRISKAIFNFLLGAERLGSTKLFGSERSKSPNLYGPDNTLDAALEGVDFRDNYEFEPIKLATDTMENVVAQEPNQGEEPIAPVRKPLFLPKPVGTGPLTEPIYKPAVNLGDSQARETIAQKATITNEQAFARQVKAQQGLETIEESKESLDLRSKWAKELNELAQKREQLFKDSGSYGYAGLQAAEALLSTFIISNAPESKQHISFETGILHPQYMIEYASQFIKSKGNTLDFFLKWFSVRGEAYVMNNVLKQEKEGSVPATSPQEKEAERVKLVTETFKGFIWLLRLPSMFQKSEPLTGEVPEKYVQDILAGKLYTPESKRIQGVGLRNVKSKFAQSSSSQTQ